MACSEHFLGEKKTKQNPTKQQANGASIVIDSVFACLNDNVGLI